MRADDLRRAKPLAKAPGRRRRSRFQVVADPAVLVRLLLLASAGAWENCSQTPGDSWAGSSGAQIAVASLECRSAGGENEPMQQPGARRLQLDETLRVAYGQGLLSDGTFVDRLDRLLGASTIDPRQLIGDLTFRAADGPRARLRRVSAGIVGRQSRRAVDLLALDWTGATAERLLIGRGPGSDILLEDDSVSRRHAELLWRGGGWVIHDLGSLNGTLLNGKSVIRGRVEPGDFIQFAEHAFRVD